MAILLESLFNGISIGAVLLIAALGLAIVFGLMGVINLAHGELIMLGAYATFVTQNVFKGFGEPWFNFYIIAALPLAFIVSGLMGLILEKGVIRYLYGRPLETLLATWGVSLILRQFVRSVNWLLIIAIAVFAILYFGGMFLIKRRYQHISNLIQGTILTLSIALATATGFLIQQQGQENLINPWFGTTNVDVTAPGWLRGGIPVGNFQIPMARIFIIVLTILCILATYWFLNKSSWGLKIRSVTQNRTMSACLGIPTEKVDALTFAIGSGLAGIAGCGISLLGSVGPNTGQNYIIDTFMVVVVGGVGNLLGTILAALGIGILNYLIGSGILVIFIIDIAFLKPLVDILMFFANTSMARVLVFGLIIIFLQIKPAGIFPPKGRNAQL
ncbi:MAG: branched-chain amino acid ABC transporter permease [Gloeocapsa sp. DLM2.Bin57]|nr:MAG: branched-chain amino acid ABC transporter permease [Gloeocapsa sp. DLM2.Bin57]